MYKLLFFLVLAFLIFSRAAYLTLLPTSLTHDETIYAIEAYSYAVQGKGADGTSSPFSLRPVNSYYAELPALMISPGFLLFKNPLIATRFTSVLMGIALPFVVAWLVYGLSKNKKIALASFIVITFNPMLIQLSRLSYDAFFSVFFYLLGAAILVNLRSYYTLLAIPLFFLGFFQYQGFKLVLIPWIALVLLMIYICKKNEAKPSLRRISRDPRSYVLLFSIALTCFYLFILLPGQSATERLSNTIFTDQKYLTERVDEQRKHTLDSPLRDLFINKGTVIGEFIGMRMAGTFNPTLLFMVTEPNVSGFMAWTHGIFYWIEGIFIILGIAILMRKKTNILFVIPLLLLILSLNISNLINTKSEWYLLRGSLLYTILLIIGSIGLAKLWEYKKLRIVVLVAYLISIANFSYHYIYRYPITSSDWANFNERVLAGYARHLQAQNPQQTLVMYGEEPYYLLYNYILYNNRLTRENALELAQQVQENNSRKYKTYRFDNIIFTEVCEEVDPKATIMESVAKSICVNTGNVINVPTNYLSVPQVIDSGTKFKIYNDTLCSRFELGKYVEIKNHTQFKVEEQTVAQFCTNWIIKQ